MYDGLNIRWRQTAPDRALVATALDELASLHETWPDTVQCDIVIERAEPSGVMSYRAHVEIDFGFMARQRGQNLRAVDVGADAEDALRSAFQKLRIRTLRDETRRAA